MTEPFYDAYEPCGREASHHRGAGRAVGKPVDVSGTDAETVRCQEPGTVSRLKGPVDGTMVCVLV